MIQKMTETILPFKSPHEEYTADALIFYCFDDRLWRLRKALIKERGFQNVDLVQLAGHRSRGFRSASRKRCLLRSIS